MIVWMRRIIAWLQRLDEVTAALPCSLLPLRYFAALGPVIVALFVRLAFNLPTLPYVFFVPAIMASALLFGMFSGFLSTILSCAFAVYFFLPPTFSVRFHNKDQYIAVGLFFLIANLVAYICATLRSTRIARDIDIKELAKARGELSAMNAQLEGRVIEEIASKERVEDVLRQSQKMEAVGQLTGGIAHDFNNILTGITGSLDLLEIKLGKSDISGAQQYIEMAKHSTGRAASLTHRLLAFSRRQTLDPKPTDIVKLVESMEELIKRTIGPTISVTVDSLPGTWPINVDVSQLENALLNLCINARDAMPDGGEIEISIRNETNLPANSNREGGDFVALHVRDTGTGIPPGIIDNIFNPFFTTKPMGTGTGLGLSMIYGFARQSGGNAKVLKTVLGEGTTMRVVLPRYVGTIPISESSSLAPIAHAEGETVLVVDDDPILRLIFEEALVDEGYNIVTAEDGAKGLAILSSNIVIDLLVTDVGMPNMDGRTMVGKSRAIRPELKVLFITGYAEAGLDNLDDNMQLLSKPFSLDILQEKVASILKG